MKSPLVAAAVSVVLACLSPGHAGEFKAELDSNVNNRLFETHFALYGNFGTDSIVLEPQGLRFHLAGSTRGAQHAGLYSYFALAGDFEFRAIYELLSGFSPPDGRSASCGIAVETESAWGNVVLTRGCRPGIGSGYVISQGKSAGAGSAREPIHFPSSAVTGMLILRRDGKELICLAADRPDGEPDELCRLPFTAATIRKARVFAESGGVATALDARISINIKAEEITGGTPKREQGSGLGWWTVAGVLVAGIIALLIYRRRAGLADAED